MRAKTNEAGIPEVTPPDVAACDARLIDVREPEELKGDLGHVRGVENVPLGALEGAARTWDRAQEIVLICRSGGRSGRATMLLTRMGFSRVYNMAGGMLAWTEAKLPIER